MKKTSTLKSILKEANNSFRNMKSIKNYIVRNRYQQGKWPKIPKITRPCYSCRKTCHLINSNETLKNMRKGNEFKKLDGGNCRTSNIIYAARCKIHGDIYIGNLERNWEKDSTNTGTMPKTDQITMNSQHKYTNTNTNLTRILKFWY